MPQREESIEEGNHPKQQKPQGKDDQNTVTITSRVLVMNDIRSTIQLYEKGVSTRTARLQSLSIRSIHKFRSKLSVSTVKDVIEQFIPLKSSKIVREIMLSRLSSHKEEEKDVAMKLDDLVLNRSELSEETKLDVSPKQKCAKKKSDDKILKMNEKDLKKLEEPRKTVTIETECLVNLILAIFLIDHDCLFVAVECLRDLLDRINTVNSRTLDLISARGYFYFSFIYFKQNELDKIRPILLAAYRTSCLRHDEPSQAVLTSCLLQNYLHYNKVAQADKFRLNSTFPEKHGGLYQHARYLYYIGRINAIQLHYSEAFQNLSQAIRKAPQTAAVGFRQQATKLLVIVQLLLGEIPERSLFLQADLKRSLKHYFLLTQAVRAGDTVQFTSVMNEYKSRFQKDTLYSLVLRLRHNVIKTGLRNISLSYSRISLEDISKRLDLGSLSDTEYIVSKAIHDGVIDAVIDKENGYIFSKETIDIYSTYEPQAQFHKRIKFCIDVHNDAVKALRYPDKPTIETDEEKPTDFDEGDIEIMSEMSDSHDGDVM